MSKNILVLHGMYQNGEILKYICTPLIDRLNNYVTLHFITGPISYENEHSDVIDLYGWWNDDDEYTGSEDSVKQIHDVFDEHGPFDGVIGFSQGAMMTSLLCALKKNDVNSYGWFSPKFIINICGHDNECLIYTDMFTNLIDVPSLHIIGVNDDIKESSIELSCRFKNPVVKMYEMGHEIPSHDKFYEDVIQFMQTM
jgi:predicted esterase